MRARLGFSFVCGLFALAFGIPSSVYAGDDWWKTSDKYASVVVDVSTGKSVTEYEADSIRHPASLTKMMTAYLVFEQLKRGGLKLEQNLYVSDYAASMPSMNINLREGDRITVNKALQALSIRSANDAAVVLAEAVGGDESAFATLMTRKARRLGMANTTFRNASGLPDDDQITTARDMVKLGIALRRDFPEYYGYFKMKEFVWNGKTYRTHNRVNLNYDGADGIKTGYIRTSGFNLVTSAQRGNKRFFATVMGGPTARQRDQHMMNLLDSAFGVSGNNYNFAEGDDEEDIGFKKSIVSSAYKTMARAESQQLSPSANAVAEPITGGADDVSGGRYVITADADSRAERTPENKGEAKASSGENEKWSIQVGAFTSHDAAYDAAKGAYSAALDAVSNSKIKVLAEGTHKTIHRARIVNLTFAQAQKACRIVHSNAGNCFVLKPRG